MTVKSRRALAFLRLLDFELEKFQEFRSSVLGSFVSELDRIGERGEALPQEEQEDYFDRMYDEIALVRDDFPPLLRSTTVIALYSVLEHRLLRVCDLLKKLKKVEGDPRDLKKGSTLDKARRFIVKKCASPFPEDSVAWAQLNGDYRLVRNCLVHNAGAVRDDEELLEVVGRSRRISLNDKGEIVLEDEFLASFSDSIRAFFQALVPPIL